MPLNANGLLLKTHYSKNPVRKNLHFAMLAFTDSYTNGS